MAKKNNNNSQRVPSPPMTPTVQTVPPAIDNESKYYAGMSSIVKTNIQTIENYCAAMAPGVAIGPEQGAANHQRLFNAIMNILNAPDVADMVTGMDRIVELFKRESRGALNAKYLYRFFDVWVIDNEQRDLFSSICLLLTKFCDDVQREKFKDAFQLEGDRNMLQYMPYEARERFLAYLQRLASK